MSSHEFPPPPPVEPPVDISATDGGGSIPLGLGIGLLVTGLGAFGPFLSVPLEGVGLLALWLIPLVLVVGIGLTIRPTTRRTGVGILVGFAIGLVVSAGTCIYLLSTAEFG